VPIVLGLDPGTRHFGWGVIERRGTRLFHIAHGIVHTDERAAIAVRLVDIEKALVEVLQVHGPAQASVEALFFAKDPQAAAKLGHARGVALLVCARAGLEVYEELAPAYWKQTLQQAETQKKLNASIFRPVSLGLPPLG